MNMSASIIALCMVTMAATAWAHKFEVLGFKFSFGLFALSLLIISVVTVTVLVKLLMSFGGAVDKRLLVALGLGALPTMLLFYYVVLGINTPRIHDISTRYSPVIAFTHAQSLRTESDNRLVNHDKNKQIQQQAYGALTSLHINIVQGKALLLALESAKSLGWIITYKDPENFSFEAVDQTALFGFKDDIRVEVLAIGKTRSRIDVRSASRVGQSDFGVNAKRIRQLFVVLKRIQSSFE